MQVFRNAGPADAARCFEIEARAYPGDEAATLANIEKRILDYPTGFLVREIDGRIAGFVNSGCAQDVVMSDVAFKELIGHDPDAPNVVILSVAVDPVCQGKGHAKALMAEFVARMRGLGKTAIHLMCRDAHVPLYEHLGFRYIRPSTSRHGGLRWHEMVMEL